MARPLEFNRDAALDQAVRLFWRKGYQAASLTDLSEAMQISRSSFYAAFGDKRGLFLECLDLFAAWTVEVLRRGREQLPPLEALRQFFERSLARPPGATGPWLEGGCLLVNTVLETAGVDEDLNARASALLTQVQAEFEDALRAAGYDSPRAAELASFLMLVNEGLRVTDRRPADAQIRRQQIATAFQLVAAA